MDAMAFFVALSGHLWSVFESLQCHYNDEVVFCGGMTEVFLKKKKLSWHAKVGL